MTKTIAEEALVDFSYKAPNKKEKEISNPMDYAVLDSEKLKKSGFLFSFSPKEGLINTYKILKEMEGDN